MKYDLKAMTIVNYISNMMCGIQNLGVLWPRGLGLISTSTIVSLSKTHLPIVLVNTHEEVAPSRID